MALTGLLAQAPQISATPNAPQAPQQSLGDKIWGAISSIPKDAFNTLIGTPATRLGQVAGNVIAPALGIPQSGIDQANAQSQNLPLGFGTVAPQKAFGQGGGEQIAGQALKSASYLDTTLAIAGNTTVGGTLGGAGNAMSQGGSTGDVVGGAVSGLGTGALVGGVLGGATGLAGNIANKLGGASSYDTNLANAEAANTQAGQTAVQGANEASGMIYGAKADAGSAFSEAPKIIEQTDPSLSLDLSNSTAEKLNALKDTKAFSLPDYLRTNSENYGNGNIDITKLGEQDTSGIRLSPTQTQDLITRLNDLQFNSKGDVVVNQQTQALINDLKGQAQDTFGHVTDPQGNSVWNNAYQKYATTMDAVHAAGDIININRTSGGMSNPAELDASIKKVMSLGDTPQGRASIGQFIQEFKNRTGYDLSDPIQAQTKLIDSNKELQDAIKGGFGHQLKQAITNPSVLGRRLVYLTSALIGIAAIGTAFRKQLGQIYNNVTGQ